LQVRKCGGDVTNNATKAQLIDLLSFPRKLVREELDELADECPHELRFAGDDQQCSDCDLEHDCSWLNENDEFSPLSLRSISRLVSALDAAITYVRGDAISWGHTSTCSCQVCEWLVEAQRMHDAMKLTGFHGEKSRHFLPENINTNNHRISKRRKQSIENNLYRLTRARIHLLRSFQSE
jgi:hypothetical protein